MYKLSEIDKMVDKTGLFPVLNTDLELRSPEAKKQYKKELKELEKIQASWTSVEDYILVTKFGYYPDWKIEHQKTFVLKPSDYPYDLIDCDFHYILWINSNDIEVIKRAIENTKNYLAGTNYIYFQNQPYNQSVGLTHFHFIGKY